MVMRRIGATSGLAIMINIGDVIEYRDCFDEKRHGKVVDVSSDMDFYDKMRLEDGVPHYYSKKLSRFVPVKEKNIDTVFLIVSPVAGYSCGEDFDYVLYNEV